MQFRKYKDEEIPYLSGFLVKFNIPPFQQTKKKLNNVPDPLLSQTLESYFLRYLLEKAIQIKSMAVEWGRPKVAKDNKEQKQIWHRIKLNL